MEEKMQEQTNLINPVCQSSLDIVAMPLGEMELQIIEVKIEGKKVLEVDHLDQRSANCGPVSQIT